MTSTDELIARMLGPFTHADRVPEEDVAAAEERLGVRLPGALRALHLACGRAEALTAGNRLVAVAELEWRADGLVVAVAEQDTVAWGYPPGDVTADDPPLLRTVEGEWEAEFASTSIGLACIFGLGAANGALPQSAYGEWPDPQPRLARALGAVLGPAPVTHERPDGTFRVWPLLGGVVAHDVTRDQGELLWVAGRRAETVTAVTDRLGVPDDDWSVFEVDEER